MPGFFLMGAGDFNLSVHEFLPTEPLPLLVPHIFNLPSLSLLTTQHQKMVWNFPLYAVFNINK